jgi:hypothetical protein
MEHVPLIGGGAVTVNPRYPVRIENDPPSSRRCAAAWEHLDEFHPVFGASISYVQLWVARGRQTAAKVELYAIWMKKNVVKPKPVGFSIHIHVRKYETTEPQIPD